MKKAIIINFHGIYFLFEDPELTDTQLFSITSALSNMQFDHYNQLERIQDILKDVIYKEIETELNSISISAIMELK